MSKAYARLIALHKDVERPEYRLDADSYTIGRLQEDCDIVVKRVTVSRIHARIERSGSHYVLTNLSRNKTFVNGTPIEETQILQDRDQIGLATAEPVLRVADPDPTLIVAEPLQYDESSMRFLIFDEPLDLTPSQLRLLQHLHRQVGQVCSRESCARAIWGEDFLPGMDADNLDKVVSGLRSRLRSLYPPADWIKSRRGLGYVLKF